MKYVDTRGQVPDILTNGTNFSDCSTQLTFPSSLVAICSSRIDDSKAMSKRHMLGKEQGEETLRGIPKIATCAELGRFDISPGLCPQHSSSSVPVQRHAIFPSCTLYYGSKMSVLSTSLICVPCTSHPRLARDVNDVDTDLHTAARRSTITAPPST